MAKHVRGPLALVVLLACATQGCGGVLYTANILGANAALEEARLADAERLSPYEYYYARACINKAREEAGDAEYQNAVELADTARDHALRARDQARAGGGNTATSSAADNASGGQAAAR